MSDGYISIVPSEIELERPEEKAQQVTQWLIAKEIVAAQQTDCVLGSPVGYPPGPRFRDALDPGENHGGFPELVTNGVEVITGRTVFDTGGNGIEEVRCPKCQANIIDSDWGDFLGEWVNGGSQFMQCPDCGQESLLTEYDFNIEKRFIWAFSNFGITFWNWPPEFKDSFIAELEQVIGSSVRIVYGRL
jgi:hypothetical protein